MKIRKFILVLVLALIIGGVGAQQGLAHVRAFYGAPCAELTGFGGVLQDLNLLAQGNCRLKKGSTTLCQDQGECSITSASGKVSGKCRSLPEGCTCVPD